MLQIEEMCDYSRYSDDLENLIKTLDGKEVLRLDYESDYQGFVDIDVLLGNGEVFSYYYSYGSCSGCDEWEADGLYGKEIENRMKQEATFFDDIQQYQEWRATVSNNEIHKQ